MKRTNETDIEWAQALADRKGQAERAMLIEDHKRGFITLQEIGRAARVWGCSQHKAEMRLFSGELPEASA